jgi:hypothetical protein
MVGRRELQISVPEGFTWYGQQNEGRRCRAIKEHPETTVLSVFCESAASIRFAECHNILHLILWFPFHDNVLKPCSLRGLQTLIYFQISVPAIYLRSTVIQTLYSRQII